jgi:hypothetical protein
VYQNFPRPERIELTGLDCGPVGAWDARLAAGWGTVLYDEGRFRAWGCSMPGFSGRKEDARCDVPLAAYFESDDGVHWRKPDLKLTGQKRWPGNNLLKIPTGVGVVRALPGAGFKFLGLTIQIGPLYPGVADVKSNEFNGTGTYLYGSDDGIEWTQMTKYPMVRHGDFACLHADPVRNRYLLYHKVASSHGLTARRSMLVLESKDAVQWEGYHGYRQWHEAFFADDYDDLIAVQNCYRLAEYYMHAIHQVDTLYLAVQTLFMVGLPLHNKIHQNPNGRSHVRLAFSHDGITWRHPRGRPVFMDGGQPGEFGAGFMGTATNILEHGDDMWLYCSGCNRDHGWGIRPDFSVDDSIPPQDQERRVRPFALKLKRDRFASLAANQTSRCDVEIGPRPGRELTINALTRHEGFVRVAIAEQRSPFHLEPRKSESLPGFSFDDCIPFRGDAVKAPVLFRKAKLANIPRDKSLILRFEISSGEVFGYEWRV